MSMLLKFYYKRNKTLERSVIVTHTLFVVTRAKIINIDNSN